MEFLKCLESCDPVILILHVCYVVLLIIFIVYKRPNFLFFLELTPKFPLFSDLEEGFEKEIEYVKENVLIPFANKEVFENDGVLSLPRGILFRGQGPAEVIVHALANEGGFNIAEISASDLLYEMTFSYPDKRTEVQKLFKNLEGKSPSILFVRGFSKDNMVNSFTERGLKVFLKMMDNISGKVLVIGLVPKDDKLVTNNFSYFPHIFDFKDEKLSLQKRKTMLKLATRNWKFAPSIKILKEVSACEKLNSKEQIENLAYSVYDYAMKNNLKEQRSENETVTMEINPSLKDWLVVLKREFGIESEDGAE